MKRLFCLGLCLLLLLAGCGKRSDTETVTFCYQRLETAYGTQDGVLVQESRTLSGGPHDLAYLLGLYLQGPENQELTLPLPSGTQLLEYTRENDMLTVTFSSHLAQLQGMDLTVACACIATTCFNLTDAQQVQIKTPNNSTGPGISISMSRNSLLTFDEFTESTSDDLP